MVWSDEKARARIEFLEAELREHPLRHRARLLSIALAGYACPAILIGLALSLVGAMLGLLPMALGALADPVEILAAWAGGLAASLWFLSWIVRTLMFDQDPPSERPLHPGAKALADRVEEVGKNLGTPGAHVILIGSTLNAGVRQSYRWGLFGKARNELTIGIPLLAILTPGELDTVLAHELGHLGGNHGRFSGWIYRINQRWRLLSEGLQSRSRGRRLPLRWFLNWYPGWLVRNSLPLRRAHEREADADGAKVHGPELAARTEVKISWMIWRQQREHRPKIWQAIAELELPPMNFAEGLIDCLRIQGSTEHFDKWRARESSAKSSLTDEHPCMADRLEAMGYRSLLIERIEPPACAAAEECSLNLLGEALPHHLKLVNAAWRNEMIGWWRFHRSQIAAAREKKKDLEKIMDRTPDHEWDGIQPLIPYLPPAETEAMLDAFLERHPGHAPALHALAVRLLALDDERGLDRMEQAIALSSDLRWPGLMALLEYHRRNSDDAAADSIILRMEEEKRLSRRAELERKKIRARDPFIAHGLPADSLDKVRRRLLLFPRVKTAWLVRKKVSLKADKPAYVLGVVCSSFNPESDMWLSRSIPGSLEIDCTVVVLGLGKRRLRSRFEQVGESLILEAVKL